MTTRRARSSETDEAGRALAACLRAARTRLGLTIRQMADLTGIAPATLSALEGGREPRWSTLMRCLETVPGLTAADLLPPVSPVPQAASRGVHAFMLDAFGYRARRVVVTLAFDADGRATREEIFEGVHWTAEPQPRAITLPRLLQACGRLPRALLRDLLNPPLDRGRIELESEGTRAEFAIGGAGDSPEITARILRPPGDVRDEAAMPLHAPTESLCLVARFAGRAPASGSLHVSPHALAPGGEDSNRAPFLHPRGVPITRDDDGRGLRATVELAMPDMRYALRWSEAAPSLADRGLPDLSLAGITRRLRDDAGLSTRDLARRMKVSHATLLAAERGRDARAETLRACLRALPGVPPQALLPAISPAAPSSPREAWEWYRDACLLECEAADDVTTVHADGTRESTRRTIDLRSLDPAQSVMQLLLSVGEGGFSHARSELRSIATEAGEAEDEVRMRTYSRSALGATYAVTIPARRSRQGVTIVQTVTNQAPLVLTLEEGFARYGSADPDIIIGGSVTCEVPSRRLRYEFRLPARARVRDPFIACKPRRVLPGNIDRRWVEQLHGDGCRAEFDIPGGLFRIEVDYPLPGFDYGIGVFVA